MLGSSRFHEPALDVLWRTQKTFRHFLGCMPDDLFTVDEGGSGQTHTRTMRLRRPILATDWDRALVYARRVRAMVCESTSGFCYSQIFPVLTMSLPADSLFPNLDTYPLLAPTR
ncbi:hypothetical protein C8R43DRAFT_610545 [Mycena crocata]|nr:hypothetical protein C8R43DRAFT_610545 [Mycena crocata]